MEIETAQKGLGGVGRWQVLMYLMISATTMFISCTQMLAVVYIGYVPDHHCNVEDLDSIPYQVKKSGELSHKFSSCKVYANPGNGSNATQNCTTGWSYVKYIDGVPVPYNYTTIVTEWDLVCSNSYLKDLTQTTLVVGVMVGAMVFSTLSDRLGRKPIFLLCHWSMIVVGVANAYVTNFYAFMVLRFISGTLQQGIGLIGVIMACELFSARYRTFAGIMIENFWAVAACLMPLLAYLIYDWRHFQLIISLLGVVTIPMYWLLPESIIWLYANGRHREAETILQKAYRMNDISAPTQILPHTRSAADCSGSMGEETDSETHPASLYGRFMSRCGRSKVQGRTDGKEKEAEYLKCKEVLDCDTLSSSTAVYSMLDLLHSTRLVIYAVVMAILWWINSMVYYGLSLSTATLAGDRFLNAFFNALVEIPAYCTCYLLLQRWGRRYPLMGYFFTAGISLILTEIIPIILDSTDLAWLIVTLSMIGKFGITGSFAIVFLYVSELFPTTLRNQALGLASLLGRIGSLIATFTPYVSDYAPWLPGPLFGALSIGGGLLVLFLPETHNRPLPQTIEEIEGWSKTPSINTSMESESDVYNDDVKIEGISTTAGTLGEQQQHYKVKRNESVVREEDENQNDTGFLAKLCFYYSVPT